MVGLGGTSTNDGGAGMLAALGVQLLDAGGRAVDATPGGLATLATVNAGGLDPRLQHSTITIMSDVDNVLAGPRGATAIFGPQKGVRPERIGELDARLARFAALVEKALGKQRTIGLAPAPRAVSVLRFSCWAAKCAPGRKSSPTWSVSMRQSRAPTG
jgi:glycerate kinase